MPEQLPEVTGHHDQQSQTEKPGFFSVDQFVKDDAAIQFYTGLSDYQTFKFVLNTLRPAAHSLTYYDGVTPPLHVLDQFFLTLIRLRLHKTNY